MVSKVPTTTMEKLLLKKSKDTKVVDLKPNTVRDLMQSGKRVSLRKDRAVKALPPGKRISQQGNIYWETRKNRSDVKGTKI